jgi:hypothetical protein
MDWQLGTFDKAASVPATLSIAESALLQANFRIFFNAKPGSFVVVGGNDNTIVNIAVAPNGSETFVAVTATSVDASAELARNQVRQFIVNG